MRSENKILIGQPERKRVHGGPRHRGVMKTGLRGEDWICLNRDRTRQRAFVYTVMNLCVLQKFGKFLDSWELKRENFLLPSDRGFVRTGRRVTILT
jgi:hypothetical protein